MQIFSTPNPEISGRSWITVLLLCIFFGWLGLHRFYAGKIITGVLFLLTGGFLGVGIALDFIMIIFKQFTDKQGRRIQNG